MPESTASQTAAVQRDDSEIDLLDLLVVIAENLKLLILGPLVVGALALGVTYLVTPTYESVSVMQTGKTTPQLVASLAQSADVLGAVAQELKVEPEATYSTRLKTMQTRVTSVVGRQDNLVTLTARASTPQRAQQLNQAVWQRVYPLTLPLPADAQRIRTQIKALQEALETGAQLEESTARRLESGPVSEGAARLYNDVQTANAQRKRDILSLQAQLEGLTDANLVQQPTLPDVAAKPKKALAAIVAALAAGIALLVYVFVREALRMASHNPQQASSLRRLRAALRLKG